MVIPYQPGTIDSYIYNMKLNQYTLGELELLYNASNEEQQKDLIKRMKKGEWFNNKSKRHI